MSAKTVFDEVAGQIKSLPSAARLVVAFDPLAALGLGADFQPEPGERSWAVLPYDGNDLAFRRAQQALPAEAPSLVWVTAPPGFAPGSLPRLELNSLADVWRRADLFIDASLTGMLKKLIPGETWPEAPVLEYAAILGQNLPAIRQGLNDLRRYLPRNAALDAAALRALALHCMQPQIPAHRFLFHADTPGRVLDAYLDLLWSAAWDVNGAQLLRQQAHSAPRLPLESIQPWLDSSPEALAVYLYLRRLLGQFGVPNLPNQLRGLGVIQSDPQALEAQAGSALARWGQEAAWRQQMICQAEQALAFEDIQKVVDLLDLPSPESVLAALERVEAPAVRYALQVKFFYQAAASGQMEKYSRAWTERPARPALPETSYTPDLRTLGGILDEIAFIDSRRFLAPPETPELSGLLDWYIAEQIYDLEYAQARAAGQSEYLRDETLRGAVKQVIKRQQAALKSFLDGLDQRLAELIKTDWEGYLKHPRLSIQVLWDAAKKRRQQPSTQACLWIVVFDGMRWDTWARHIRPRLLQNFEIIEAEKPYLCLLPSWTMVARTGLLAGKQPAGWKNYRDNYSSDQAELAARLFGIPDREKNRQLSFFAHMESDRKLESLSEGRRTPYAVLVYNISDDNLHSIHSDLVGLNKVVDTLLDDIFQSLNNLVQPGDSLVISSDHGFIELEEGSSVTVPDDNRIQRQLDGDPNPVRHRYILGHTLNPNFEAQHAGRLFKITYPNADERFHKFTVAVGRTWFRRAQASGPEPRYAHGGLSLAEMVVPGVLLRRITEKRLKIQWSVQPAKLELLEGETASLAILVENQGNVSGAVRLSAQADTAEAETLHTFDLAPGARKTLTYPVTAIYRKSRSGEEQSTRGVKLNLEYTTPDGKLQKPSKHVPVSVRQRTDRIEIDFGGLSDLDI